jgi:hypothetical protein
MYPQSARTNSATDAFWPLYRLEVEPPSPMSSLTLRLGNRVFEFVPAPIKFSDIRISDVFGRKNNKTLGQTLQHRRYVHLADRAGRDYPTALTKPLGDFLLDLKRSGDPFYREFLNPYGDESFCQFRLGDGSFSRLKGLYCFTVAAILKYIGKSTDTFKKRITQGYGCIHPKNCYLDGQATNCHLNALIANCIQDLGLFVHPMTDDEEIGAAEATLIANYRPDWNIQLK